MNWWGVSFATRLRWKRVNSYWGKTISSNCYPTSFWARLAIVCRKWFSCATMWFAKSIRVERRQVVNVEVSPIVIIKCSEFWLQKLYLIVSGTVAVYTNDGDEVAHLKDGNMFGEVEFLHIDEDNVRNSADCWIGLIEIFPFFLNSSQAWIMLQPRNAFCLLWAATISWELLPRFQNCWAKCEKWLKRNLTWPDFKRLESDEKLFGNKSCKWVNNLKSKQFCKTFSWLQQTMSWNIVQAFFYSSCGFIEFYFQLEFLPCSLCL